ncbi:MAG: hypothetical protein V1800_05345 [Candidatus Latescibacterota bacterium]
MTSKILSLRKVNFLIHPLTYAPECEGDYENKEFYRVCREVENRARRRYHEAIDTMGEEEALVIYPCSPDFRPQELVDIEAMARRKLGRRLIVCSYPTVVSDFLDGLEAQGLTYDPRTVETEAWGESFDGCVAKYCARFSKQLGLAQPICQNVAMCVPDSILLLKASFVEQVSLPSKIRVYLFETQEKKPLAIFFESYYKSGDLARWVEIPIDPSRVDAYEYLYVATLTPTPMTPVLTADGKGLRLPICTDLATPPQRGYLVGRDVGFDFFRAAVLRATVVAPS